MNLWFLWRNKNNDLSPGIVDGIGCRIVCGGPGRSEGVVWKDQSDNSASIENECRQCGAAAQWWPGSSDGDVLSGRAFIPEEDLPPEYPGTGRLLTISRVNLSCGVSSARMVSSASRGFLLKARRLAFVPGSSVQEKLKNKAFATAGKMLASGNSMMKMAGLRRLIWESAVGGRDASDPVISIVFLALRWLYVYSGDPVILRSSTRPSLNSALRSFGLRAHASRFPRCHE